MVNPAKIHYIDKGFIMIIQLSKAVSLAKKIAKNLKGGEILALSGELGSGKTTFTKALGKELGVKETITSPTFVLMQQYQTSRFSGNKKPLWLYHLDLYRTKNFDEVKGLGIEEILGHPETITVIEWSDKIEKSLPSKIIKIEFHRDAN